MDLALSLGVPQLNVRYDITPPLFYFILPPLTSIPIDLICCTSIVPPHSPPILLILYNVHHPNCSTFFTPPYPAHPPTPYPTDPSYPSYPTYPSQLQAPENLSQVPGHSEGAAAQED